MSVSERIQTFLEDNIRTVLGENLTGDVYVEMDGKWVEVYGVEDGVAEVSGLWPSSQAREVRIDRHKVYRTLDRGSPFRFVDGMPEPSGWPSGSLIYVEEAYQALKWPDKGFSENRLSGVYLYSEDFEDGKSYYVPAEESALGDENRSLDEDYDLILRWHPVDVRALAEYEARRD